MEIYEFSSTGSTCGGDDSWGNGGNYGEDGDDGGGDDGDVASMVTVTAALTLGVSGLSCDDYGTAEEGVLNSALSDHIDGATEYTDHECTDASRRALRSYGGGSYGGGTDDFSGCASCSVTISTLVGTKVFIIF